MAEARPAEIRNRASLRSLVETAIEERLRHHGFIKRSGHLLTSELTKGVLSWIGLNGASFRGSVYLTPTVGVRHQALERVVAELKAVRFERYGVPTVNKTLMWVSHRRRGWDFYPEAIDAVADELVSAAADYALPFMNGALDLPGVADYLDRGYAHPSNAIYRRPIVAAMLGDYDDARRRIAYTLEEMADQRTPVAVAEHFRAYADRALDYVDALDTA